MKKNLLLTGSLVAMLALAGSASANELPIDEGIVIDTSTTEEIAPTVTEAEITETEATVNTVTPEVVDSTDVQASDGTVLPVDAGDVNAVEQGTEEVVAPQEDSVTLTENTPVVEPLPQTSIESNALLYTLVAALLGVVALVLTRRKTAE